MVLGITCKENMGDLENFVVQVNKQYGIFSSGTLGNYGHKIDFENKVFEFELNFEKGTFSIVHEDDIVYYVPSGILGNTFIPFARMNTLGDEVTLLWP